MWGRGGVTGTERSISLTVLGAVHATDDAEVVTLGIILDILRMYVRAKACVSKRGCCAWFCVCLPHLQQTTSAYLAEVQYLHRGGIQADQTSSFLGAPSVEL